MKFHEKTLHKYFWKNNEVPPTFSWGLGQKFHNYEFKTLEEWKAFYCDNIYSEEYIEKAGCQLYKNIPLDERSNITEDECINYLKDIIFRRTFLGFRKEYHCLKYLQEKVNSAFRYADEYNDRFYGIDFEIEHKGKRIGVQLKSSSILNPYFAFNLDKVKKAMQKYNEKFNGSSFIMIYNQDQNPEQLELVNPEILIDIEKALV